MAKRDIKNIASKNREIIKERAGILDLKTPFPTKEEYKALRANITFSLLSSGCKIIGITSANRMEGKSITCLNLAISFAETKARVLIIDCDLRLPKIAMLVSEPEIPGISNVLFSLNSIDDVIHHMEYFGLDVILSGDIPPNPSELLGSDKMRETLDKLSERYDYIFVDTSPVNVVSDAVVLSKQFTGMVFVVKAGSSQKDFVISAINQLKFVGANILGFILNGVPAGVAGRNKQYYYK